MKKFSKFPLAVAFSAMLCSFSYPEIVDTQPNVVPAEQSSGSPTGDDIFLNNMVIAFTEVANLFNKSSSFWEYCHYLIADLTITDICNYKIDCTETSYKESFGETVLADESSDFTLLDFDSATQTVTLYVPKVYYVRFSIENRDKVTVYNGYEPYRVIMLPKVSTSSPWVFYPDGSAACGGLDTKYDQYFRISRYGSDSWPTEFAYFAKKRLRHWTTTYKGELMGEYTLTWTDENTPYSFQKRPYRPYYFEITKRAENGLWTEMIMYSKDSYGNRTNIRFYTRTFTKR